MKTRFAFLLLLLVTVISAPLRAGEAKSQEVRGVVTTVVGSAVSVASDKLGEMAYGTNGQTKIVKLDGKSGKLSDVVPGLTVIVTTVPGNANQAGAIQVVQPKQKYEKKASKN